MENESLIVFEGEGGGETMHADFTESTLTFSSAWLPPDKHIRCWREIAFVNGKWHHPTYRNWGIPNG